MTIFAIVGNKHGRVFVEQIKVFSTTPQFWRVDENPRKLSLAREHAATDNYKYTHRRFGNHIIRCMKALAKGERLVVG